MKYLKNLGYEIYFIDKAYYKARIAYKEKRKYEKTLFFYHQNVKNILVNLFPLM